MTSLINGCTYMACASCHAKKFVPLGGEMHTTGWCARCRSLDVRPKPEPTAPLQKKAYTVANRYNVRPGQTWRSLDKRQKGRTIDIVRLTTSHAVVISNGKGGPKSRKIRLDQFRSYKGRGYELT
jgi:hypothetical protein